MNVVQRKIDDQRSVFRRVFPSKNTLRDSERPVFYYPGEFIGRGAETLLHKRKVEILRFRNTRFELKFTPETKKTTKRLVGRKSKNCRPC